jgi:uncharacterized protein YggE
MKLLLFVLLILPGVLFAQGGLPNQPYIYVEGKAEIEKPADMVTLRFEVVAQEELWTKAITNAREQAEKTLNPVGMKVDSVFAISPVPVPEISSTMFPKDRAGGAGAERVIVTGSNIPTAEGAKPSQYHLAPITVTQIVHIIYLISPAK